MKEKKIAGTDITEQTKKSKIRVRKKDRLHKNVSALIEIVSPGETFWMGKTWKCVDVVPVGYGSQLLSISTQATYIPFGYVHDAQRILPVR